MDGGTRGQGASGNARVGAAFDFHADKVRQAPNWLQNKGLEWLFRLFTEPGRLWKRYLKHNPRFAVLRNDRVGQDKKAKPRQSGKAVLNLV